MNKLVIFDLDGVLFESRDMHFETLNKALEWAGFKPIPHDEHLARFNGLPTRVKLNMLGIVGQDAERVRTEKQAHTLGWVYKNVKRNPELVALFERLKIDDYKIAVASNAITVTVVRALQLLGLWELCDCVTGGDRTAHPKPDPTMYQDCMVRCGSDPAHTIIVEDSPVGIEGARRSGAAVIEVSGPGDVVQKVSQLV